MTHRPSDGVLLFLILAIAVLLLLALVFAVAVVLLHLRNERRARYYQELERRWEPALLDALSGERPFDAALVQRRDRAQFIWYVVRLARRLRGEERAMLQYLAALHLPLIAQRLTHGSAEVRARAVQTLTILGMPAYAVQVVRALDDESPLVAMTAARGLARPEHAEHAPAVLARIERFARWNHRFLATMLSSMGEAAVPSLRAVLADAGAAEDARTIAADALGQLRDLASADIAERIVLGEPNRNVVAAALALLAIVGSERHLHAVIALLEAEESWVRAQAVETLAHLGSRAHVDVLRRALDDGSPWVALRAAYGLEEIGATDELQRLALTAGHRSGLAREVLSRSPA